MSGSHWGLCVPLVVLEKVLHTLVESMARAIAASPDDRLTSGLSRAVAVEITASTAAPTAVQFVLFISFFFLVDES